MIRAIRTILTGHGFDVEAVGTGQEALDRYSARRPDIIVLDLGLPDMGGVDVVRAVRALDNTPIIVLSVRDAERDKVAALDVGADDYVTKPFGVEELLARIRVALRHAAHPVLGSEPVFRTADLQVDVELRRVSVGGTEVHLTPTEYDLLKAFITHPDKVLTDRMLLQQVWGPEYTSEAHYLHVYVARLRRKLSIGPSQARYLVTEPGVGYRLLGEAT
ncbi:MAG: response regulator transcription factor [Chloroflexi bacterium]|nr:response regulator transcription factor [Chloroflexota bacterium]